MPQSSPGAELIRVLAQAGVLIAAEMERIQAPEPEAASPWSDEPEDRLRDFAGDALRALEELRRVTGVDEWDESDWRALAYNDACELLGEERYGEIMGEVGFDHYVRADDVEEALKAIDDYAAKDLDHDLHSLIEHYRAAIGCKA